VPSHQESSAWQGPAASRLKRIYGRPPLEVVLSAVQTLRIDHGITGPAFSPHSYATALGVQVNESAALAVDGLLAKTDDGLMVVTLRKSAPSKRKRFTLAHEVAHAMLFEALTLRDERLGEPITGHDLEEERLCNLAAAEMLMPRIFFARDIRKDDILTPLSLFRAAATYGVSLQAAANQAVSILPSLICVFWERQGRNIEPLWVAPKYVEPLRPCLNGHSSIEAAFRSPGEVSTHRDTFYRLGHGRLSRLTTTCTLNDSKAFSVIAPARTPRNLR